MAGSLGFKYIGITAATLAAFVNFVACGAQMYKVSLAEDHDERKVPAEAKDPDSTQFGIHSPAGWVSLPIKYEFSHELTSDQRSGLKKAMKIWETAVGRKLFEYVGDDERTGDTFKDLYSSLSDGENAFYLDANWAKTGKSDMVLATTIWDNAVENVEAIRTADIRFNQADYLIGDTFTLVRPETDMREIVDGETLALHELGHMLGLVHKAPEIDAHSIMNPSIFIGQGLANRRLSYGDIASIQQIYGCQGAACDIDGLVAAMDGDPDYTVSNTGTVQPSVAP